MNLRVKTGKRWHSDKNLSNLSLLQGVPVFYSSTESKMKSAPFFFFFFFFFWIPGQLPFSLCQNVSLRTPEHNTPVFHFKNTISLQEDRKNLQIATDLPVSLASFSTWPILGDILTHILSDASKWKPRCLMVDFAAPDSLIILIWVTSWSDAFHICYLCFQLHQCKHTCIVKCLGLLTYNLFWILYHEGQQRFEVHTKFLEYG